MLYPNLNPLYVTSVAIDPVFIDKSTGQPLQNGKVYFWRDADRIVPKPVYELTGTAPNYSFQELPNYLGTGPNGGFVDANGIDVAVYYYPWDDQSPPNLDLYYIEVYNEHGVLQCTRQAWPYPNIAEEEEGQETGPTSLSNIILNSQFGFVDFNPSLGPLVYNITTGNNQVFNFAPGWSLIVSATGTAQVTINQLDIRGQLNYPGQPATSLIVSNSGAITYIAIQQVLTGNPNIFAQDALGFGGYVNTSIMLNPNTAVTVLYMPNGGATNYPVLLTANNNTSGLPMAYSNTVQLPQGQNPLSNPAGSTAIQIKLTPGTTNQQFTAVQVVPSYISIPNVAYQQTPLIRQQGELFGIYQPALNYKPTSSYLVGWDFPLNPAQFNGAGTSGSPLGPYNTGANTGSYFWDQTIVYQTVTSGVSGYRAANGGLTLKCAANGQIAVLQYLAPPIANKILADRASVHINASTSITAGLIGTVTLWACSDMTLPNVATGTNLTPITAINAMGVPTMGNGTWTLVPNLYQNDEFQLQTASSTNSESADIYLNGWDLQGAAIANSATFFCIVVGFAPWTMTAPDTITLNSIGLCPGDIATRPNPKTQCQTNKECEEFYCSSFPPGVVPAQNAGTNTGYSEFNLVKTTGSGNGVQAWFRSTMRAVPNVTTYNPSAANAQIRDLTAGDFSGTSVGSSTTQKNVFIAGTPNGSSSVGNICAVHWSADARLGIV